METTRSKCPYCGYEGIESDFMVCPECRSKLPQSPLTVIKHKGIWDVVKGEIACRISEKEFESMNNLSGLIIGEGRTAIVYIDGKRVAQISGGVFNFVSNAEIDEILNKKVINNSTAYGLGKKAWRALSAWFTGEKVKDRINGRNENEYNSLEDIIKTCNANSVISVYLKNDNDFSLVMGAEVGNDSIKVNPYKIRTKHVDADFVVSLSFRISNFDEFIKYYMSSKDVVTTTDLLNQLRSYIPAILQDELGQEELTEYGISMEARNRIVMRFKALDSVLHGVEIVNVYDISCSNATIERFRHVAEELYCNEKELDFLKRTNVFKNRLASEENEQKLKEARNTLEFDKALQEINKDRLLHEDEKEQFLVLLNNQKKIREAQNEYDVTKALREIERLGLVSDDEFNAIKAEFDFKNFDRENVYQIMRLQSNTALRKKNLEVEAEIAKCKIDTDLSVTRSESSAQIERIKLSADELDYMELLYGKQYAAQKQRLLESQEINSLANQYRRSDELAEAAHKNQLLAENITGRGLEDEYYLEKARKQSKLKQEEYENERINKKNEKLDELEINEKNIELIMKIQQDSSARLAQMMAQEEAAKQAEHNRQMAEIKEQHSHEINVKTLDQQENIAIKQMEHDEEMARIEKFDAEQLFVSKLDSNSEAAKTYAEKFSSQKELDAYLKAEAKIAEERAKSDAAQQMLIDSVKEAAANQMDMVAKMSETMKNAMSDALHTNANMATQFAAGQRERETENFNRFERISTYKADEMSAQAKAQNAMLATQNKELHEQLKHEQARHDKHQDQALNYTTRSGNSSTKQETAAKKNEDVFYIDSIDMLANIPFGMEQLKQLAQNGTLKRDTVIKTPAGRCYASDINALSSFFEA